MVKLHELTNTRVRRNKKRVGRGPGSKRGKTCGKGNKGDKARSGYKNHYGHEGGQLPLYRKVPARGFSNERFRSEVCAINLSQIEEFFFDGDVVNLEALQQKGFAPRRCPGGLKILANGELTKKVTIEAHAFSAAAKEKLDQCAISYKVVEQL